MKMKMLYAHEGDSAYDEMFTRFLFKRGYEVQLFSVLNVTRPSSGQREQHTHTKPFDHKNPIVNVLLLTTLLHRVNPDVLIGNHLLCLLPFSDQL